MNISSISPQQITGGADIRAAKGQAGRQKLLSELSAQSQPGDGANGINEKTDGTSRLHEKFDAFVGESFYGQMLQAMHKTVGKTPYFNGGRAEEAFQGQLDQVLSQQMTKADDGKMSNSMFDLFNLQTQGGGRR